MPPSKYSDMMTKTCEKLEANLKKLDDIEESRRQRKLQESQESEKAEIKE